MDDDVRAGSESDTLEPIGIYLHVPFCEQKCAYCDFFTVTDPDRAHPLFDSWLDLCLAELRLWFAKYPVLAEGNVATIFLGGGTPSLLPPAQFAAFIDAVKKEVAVDPDVEISLETQPGTLDVGDYDAMVAAGINRFSIGVQTFNERLLTPTARRHTVAEAEHTLRRAAATGVTVSLDMICALPGQTMDEWQTDLERAISFNPQHMSVYEMTYHAGTQYYRQWKRGQITESDDAVRAEMFRFTRSRLQEAGYAHYEISNYAKLGFESRHNKIYWTLGDFVGLGAGAHSYIGGRRFANPRSANDYAKAVREGRLFARPHDSDDADITLVENLQMAMRLTAGVDFDWLAGRLGQDIRITRLRQLEKLEQRGWIDTEENRLRLTDDGQLYADSVSEFLL